MRRRLFAAWVCLAACWTPAFSQIVELPPAAIEAQPIGAKPETAVSAATELPAKLGEPLMLSLPAEFALQAMEPLNAAPRLPGSAPSDTDRSRPASPLGGLNRASSLGSAESVFDGRNGAKLALAAGAAVGVLAPIAYAAAPPLMAIHTGWAAAASVAAVSAASAAVRLRNRATAQSSRFSPGFKRAVLFGSLLALGLATGSAIDGPSWGIAVYAAGAGTASAGAFAGATEAARAASRLWRKLTGREAPTLSNDGVGAAAALSGLLIGVEPERLAGTFHSLLAAGLAALVAPALAKLAVGAVKGAASWARRPSPPSKASTAAFALGLALGAWPYAADGKLAIFEERIVRTAAHALAGVPDFAKRIPPSWQPLVSILANEHGLREIGPAFGGELLLAVEENPEGRTVLAQLKDRGGSVRPPRFMIAPLAYSASGFYFPAWNAVLISPRLIEREGWTVDEFLADPAKQRKLARDDDALVFHELVHAGQYRRRVFFPGQLDHFPRQLGNYLHMEMEYEAHFEEYAYIQEKLKDDPHAPLPSEARFSYEMWVTDLDDFWTNLDESPTYRRFIHIDNAYYRDRIGRLKSRWPAMSVEGYRLLALRALPDRPDDAEDYFARARVRARLFGLPEPAPIR
jgi:hypothetical protein